MTDAVSTLQLGVQTKEALDNLMALQNALRSVKGEMATLSTPLTGSSGLMRALVEIRDEVQKLNTRFDDFTSRTKTGMRSAKQGAEELKEAVADVGAATENLTKLQSKRLADHQANLAKTRAAERATTQEVSDLEAKRSSANQTYAEKRLKDAQKVRDAERTTEREVADLAAQRANANTAHANARLANIQAIRAAERAAAQEAMELDAKRQAQAQGYAAQRIAQARSNRATELAKEAEEKALDAVRTNNANKYPAQRLAQRRGTAVDTETPIVTSADDMKKLTTATRDYSAEGRQARTVTQAHAESMREAHSAARGLAGGFNAMWLTWGSIVPLLAGFTIATTVRSAVQGFSEIQYQMTFVKALAEGTADSVTNMTLRLQDAATALGVKGSEAAKGMRALAQAGLDTEQAFTALPTAFKVAVVGETSVAQAATSLTGIMNAFGMQVGQMGKIGDVLVKAGALSATSVDKMTESMKVAAPTAHQFKVSLEESATALTVLAKSNITGTAGGTSFKNMIKELAAPSTEEVKKIQKMLNFSAFMPDHQTLKPLFQQIDELKTKLEPFDRESQGAILVKMFGEKGDKAFFSLITQGKTAVDELMRKIDDSGGFTAGVFLKLQGTVKGQWQMLLAELDNTMSAMGKAGEGGMVEAMREIRAFIRDPAVKEGIIGLTQSVLSLGRAAIMYGPPVLAFFAIWKGSTMIATTILTVVGAMGGLAAVAGPVAGGLTVAAGAATAAAGATTTLGTALAMVVPPWLRILSLLASAAALYLLVKQRKDSLTGSAEKEVSGLGDAATQLENENKRLRTELDARRAGKSISEAAAASSLEEAARNVENLRRAKDALENRIGTTIDNGPKAYTGPASQYDPFSSLRASKMTENLAADREDLVKATDKLNKAEADLIRLRKAAEANTDLQKGMRDQDKIDEEIAKKKAEAAMKAGTRHYDPTAEKAAKQAAAAKLGVDNQELKNEYRTEIALARDKYTNQLKIAEAYHKNDLTSTAEYLAAKRKAQAEYDKRAIDALEEAKAGIDALPAEKVDAEKKKALRQRLDLEKVELENQQKVRAQQDASNESTRLAVETAKALGEARKFATETLPKMATEADRVRQLEREKALIATLPEDERNIATAKLEVAQAYEKQNSEIEREIKLIEERMAKSREVEAAGSGTTTESRIDYDAAVDSIAHDTKLVEAKRKSLELSRQQAQEQVKLAAGAAKAMNEQNKWNTALQRAQDIASKLSSTFGRIGTAIGGLTVAFMKYGKTQEDIEKRLEARRRDADGDPVKLQQAQTEAQRESAQAQIENYADMAGAAKGFFNEQTTGYQILQAAERAFRVFEMTMAVESALKKAGLIQTDIATWLFGTQVKNASEVQSVAVVEASEAAKQATLGTTAVLTQGQGDPYSAFARMAAMAAIVAALGVAIGGMGSASQGPKSASEIRGERRKAIGTDGLDGSTPSKSIDNSLELMAKNSAIGLTHTNAMRRALENIRDNISAIGYAVQRTQPGLLGDPKASFAGEKFNVKDTGFLGFSSSTKELLDAGLSFQWESMAKIMDGVNLTIQAFQDIRETSDSWWGLSTDTEDFRRLAPASQQVVQAVSDSVRAVGDALIEAGQSLGMSKAEAEASLDGISFKLGDTSFAGLSSDEANQQMNALLSDFADQSAKLMFDKLHLNPEQFRRPSERLAETAQRVGSSVEVARAALSKVGVTMIDMADISNKKAEDLAAENVRESILARESISYQRQIVGASAGGGMGGVWEKVTIGFTDLGEVMKNLDGTAEELVESYDKLVQSQLRMHRAGTGRITDALLMGVGGVDELASSMKTLSGMIGGDEETRKINAAAAEWDILNQKFASFNLAMPKTREEYVALIASLATQGASSDELRGRVLALSDAMDEAFENDPARLVQEKALSSQTKLVDALKDSVQSLMGVIKNSRNAIKEIDKFLLPEGQKLDNSDRIEELRAMLGRDNLTLEQQMELAGELKDLVLEKYDTEKQNATDLLDFAKQLKGYLEDLKTGDLSPLTATQRLQEARSQYESTLAKAQSGDADARDQLTQKADTYLKQAREYFASSGNYTNIFDTVYGALEQLQLSTEAGAQDAQTAATQQNTEEIRAVRDILEAINEQAQTKYDQQIIELKNALVWQQKIEGQLGVANTQLSQLASMPADIASALAETFPGLKNFDPTKMLTPGTGVSTVFPRITAAYSPFSSAMEYSEVHQGESYDDRFRRIYTAMFGVDPSTTGGRDLGANTTNGGLSANWMKTVGYTSVYDYDAVKDPTGTGSSIWQSWVLKAYPELQGQYLTLDQYLQYAATHIDQRYGRITGAPYDGSHYAGLDYVPFDNYTARLHAGERVLTAAQTRDADATASEVRALRQAVERMCEEHRDHTAALIRAQYDSTDRAAEKIVDGQHEAVDNVSWKNESEPTLR